VAKDVCMHVYITLYRYIKHVYSSVLNNDLVNTFFVRTLDYKIRFGRPGEKSGRFSRRSYIRVCRYYNYVTVCVHMHSDMVHVRSAIAVL
jgi:hypothetical protein